MATVEKIDETTAIIHFSKHDRHLQEQRQIAQYKTFPLVLPYVSGMIRKSPKCPICGTTPHVETLWDNTAPLGIDYRLFCPQNELHTGYGTHQPSMAKAVRDWKKRTRDKEHIAWWYESEKDFT